jgi:hypothetical protein
MGDEESFPVVINEKPIPLPGESRGSHQKKMVCETPRLSLSEINWTPEFRVTEWMWHTRKMLVIEWFPLVYFAVAGMLARRDNFGCFDMAQARMNSLFMDVFIPVLALRMLGIIFLNKPRLIIYQFLIIYGY